MAADDLTPKEKIALITSQLQEVLRSDILEQVIVKENRPLKVYWGTATTGRPHCGYFVPHFKASRYRHRNPNWIARVKIAHFLRAGCRVIVLCADVHAGLDALKSPWELIEARAQYYKFTVQAVLKALGVPLQKLEFKFGSEHQYSKPYQYDLLRLSSVTTEHDAKKAGAEVVKQEASPLLSGLIYPLMQALDEEHLGVDAQFGGVDQRKIFTFAGEQLPKLGYKERAHLMNPMVPGLAGGKMSASDPDSKIDFLDQPDIVRKKIRKAFAAPKEPDNGLISFVEYVLLPTSALKQDSDKGQFVVERKEGEPLIYDNAEQLRKDYAEDIVTPQLLKQAVTDALNALLAPIQAEYQANEEWQKVTLKAYPPPVAPAKKEGKKKEKKLGTKFPTREKQQPAAAEQQPAVVAQPDGHVEGPDKAKVDVGKPL